MDKYLYLVLGSILVLTAGCATRETNTSSGKTPMSQAAIQQKLNFEDKFRNNTYSVPLITTTGEELITLWKARNSLWENDHRLLKYMGSDSEYYYLYEGDVPHPAASYHFVVKVYRAPIRSVPKSTFQEKEYRKPIDGAF